MSRAKKHKCTPMMPYCCCSMIADEPSWKCPIHGGAIINRCECGRFVRPIFYGEQFAATHSEPMSVYEEMI
jgi:hypothetical protein